MTNQEFDKMLVDVMKAGVRLTMFMQGEIVWVDMNTGMKSDLRIAYVDGVCICEGRYGHQGTIEDFDDLVYEIRGCNHGRGFMNSEWEPIIGKVESSF